MPTTTPTERYRRRREAGQASREQTRRLLLQAADALFREQGYTDTTVTAIAAHAGVSLQTLYLAWGSKSALFRGAADAAASDATLPRTSEAWRAAIHDQLADETGPNPTAARYLTAVAHVFVGVATRTAAYWQMQPAAAAADPEIAAGHRQTMEKRRTTMDGVARDIPADGLRADLDPTSTAQTLWALASPETYALFTTQAGETPERYEQWLTTTLIHALCAPSVESPRRVP